MKASLVLFVFTLLTLLVGLNGFALVLGVAVLFQLFLSVWHNGREDSRTQNKSVKRSVSTANNQKRRRGSKGNGKRKRAKSIASGAVAGSVVGATAYSLLDEPGNQEDGDQEDNVTTSWNENGGFSCDPMEVNPATGLPMIGGSGGVDVGGNMYGCDSHIFDSGINDSFSSGFDDSFSSFDDSFSSFDSDF